MKKLAFLLLLLVGCAAKAPRRDVDYRQFLIPQPVEAAPTSYTYIGPGAPRYCSQVGSVITCF